MDSSASVKFIDSYGKKIMKQLRYGISGNEKPGMLDDNGVIRDLSGFVDDIADEILSRESIEK